MQRFSFITIFLLSVCSMAVADTLIFKNGDQLSGKIKSLTDGKVVFASDEIGEQTIELNRLRTFSTDEPVEFHLNDGTVIKSRLRSAEENQVILDATDLVPARRYDFSVIAAINPPPPPKPKWTGSFTIGLTSTHGNTFTESANVSFDAKRRSEKDRITLSSLYVASRAEEEVNGKKEKVTTEESFTIGGKYDYFFTPKTYGFANGSFKKDHIADLDRRIIAGLGVGHQWIEQDDMNFNTDVGIAERCEQYTTHGVTTKSDDLSVQLGYHFDWKINDKFTFIHNLTYYPSFEQFSDYFLNTDAEIRASITENLFASFKAILDYDSTPAEDVGSTDTKYILGAGWKF